MSSQEELSSLPSQSVISEVECWRLLAGQTFGRLATPGSGAPEIFPVSFAFADHRLYLRTGEGTKLATITLTPDVTFEVDEVRADVAWSVVVKGRAQVLSSEPDLEEARATGLVSYLEEGRSEWIRIVPTEISGRRLIPGEA